MNQLVILFGAGGQIGSSICRLLQAPNSSALIRTVPWSVLHPMSWDDRIRLVLGLKANGDQGTVVCAGGVTNPAASRDIILEANLEFPLSIVRALADIPGFRFMTLGTIMEHFPEACRHNAYLASKQALGSAMSVLSGQPSFAGRLLHLRLHTIYSSAIPEHMFLGQMATSLRFGRPFQMSAGHQLREYHHADDFAMTVQTLLSQPWRQATLDISTGLPIQLQDLAKEIFGACGRPDLLQIGQLETPLGENDTKAFPASEPHLVQHYRDARQGAVQAICEFCRLPSS